MLPTYYTQIHRRKQHCKSHYDVILHQNVTFNVVYALSEGSDNVCHVFRSWPYHDWSKAEMFSRVTTLQKQWSNMNEMLFMTSPVIHTGSGRLAHRVPLKFPDRPSCFV